MKQATIRLGAILVFNLSACGAEPGPAIRASESRAMADTDADAGGGGDCDAPALVALRCAGCHGAESPAADLDLASPRLRERLADAPASEACGDHALIDTQDPTQSLIYQQVTDDPPCAPRMPLGSILSEDEQACLLQWLTAD